MSCPRLFGGLFLAGAFFVFGMGATPAAAQCATCATPAVSYAPAATYTTAYAPAPVVYQTYRPGWYPGALLDRWRINRWSNRTYTTAYAPASATAYTAAYTPTYPPSYYAASYRPAYPLNYTVGYAPTVAYSPVTSCATCCTDPCACSQQVVMRPVCDGCAPCVACETGSYVGQAVYESPSTGCVGCAPGSTYVAPSSPTPTATNSATQPPAIPPGANVPEQREAQRPTEAAESPEESVLDKTPDETTTPMNGEGESEPESGAPSTMFQAPQLFNPKDHVTQRPNVPVWTAVYHNRDVAIPKSAQPVAKSPSARPTAADAERDAQGWTSAGR